MTLSIKDPGSALTHFIGMILAGLAATPLLVLAAKDGGRYAVPALAIFAASMILLYGASTTYHTFNISEKVNKVLRKIDHMMIFILIAGSYTPVALSLVGGWLGYSIIVLQWGTTIFGILYKIFAKKINEKFSLFLYLMMGWLVIFIIPAIVTKTGPAFWGLMLAGGLSYTVGAAFYAKKKPYFHMIWHLFIMLASALQYMGIVYFMLL